MYNLDKEKLSNMIFKIQAISHQALQERVQGQKIDIARYKFIWLAKVK
jgi:hypothetical protein